MAPKPLPRRKDTLPVFLEGATAFAEDAAEMGSLELVQLLKRHPQFCKPLAEAIDRDPMVADGAGPFGRPPLDGNGRWELAYLAFVMSGHIDIQPWWKNTGDDLWRECGFELQKGRTRVRPPYQTVYRWFAWLEDRAEAFAETVALLIAHARKQPDGEHIGRDIHVDSTEAETNARLLHICPEKSPCWEKWRSPYTRGRVAAKSANANLDEVKAERHAASEIPEEELTDELLVGPGGSGLSMEDGRLIFKAKDGCRYEILDKTAGVRAYTTPSGAVKRFWVGFYNHKAIDHYTGAPVAIHLSSASVPEYGSYPELLGRVVEAAGRVPRAVVADRGYSLSSVFQLNTEQGTASVIPWRKRGPRSERSAEDCDAYDRHGIPRCRHCGAEGRFVRFHKANPTPRIWYRCSDGKATPKCGRTQSISCSTDWRLLLPLWRDTETYLALSNAHQRYERVHHHWRSRYRVGSDDHKLRPKRRGIACQQLRANAALVAEWLQILWREGWLGSARRNKCAPTTASAADDLRRMRARRRAVGLASPYGTAARKLSKTAPMRPIERAAATGPPDDGPPPDRPAAPPAE